MKLRSTLAVSAAISALFVATTASAFNILSLPAHPSYETRFMAGLQWNFGTSNPELVLGARRTETQSDNSVLGGKFDLAIPINTVDFMKPVVRVMGLGGNRDVQGEFGFAMRLIDWKPMLSLDAQGPYSTAGFNLGLDWKIDPFAGFNSLNRPSAPYKFVARPPV
jgi:hypothetical protein